MTLEQISDASQAIAAAAVVASLIYLGLQVRQAERNQRAFMHQARADRVTSASLRFSERDIAEIIDKAGKAELTSSEVIQLYYFLRVQIVALDDALWQEQAGMLDADAAQTVKLTTARLLANPALRATWELARPNVSPRMVERIERMIRDEPAAAPMNWAEEWKRAYLKHTSPGAA